MGKKKKPASKTVKVPVELEFDDPAFVELYEMIAKMRGGVSLGRIAAWGLQSLAESTVDGPPDDKLRQWFEWRLGKKRIRELCHNYW